MDLTALAAAIVFAFGLLTVDSVVHSGGVDVEVTAPEFTYKGVIDRDTLEDTFTHKIWKIAGTVSMVVPPEVRTAHEAGIAMLLAERVHAKDMAYAVQRELGYEHDRLRFALYMTDSQRRGVVSGFSHRYGLFREEFVPAPAEPLGAFVERSAVWGASQLAPYLTALYLLQSHVGDGDFRDVVALCDHTIAALPVAPVLEKRGQFENLLGLVALFQKDLKSARSHFEAAAAAWPEGVVPELNVAFIDLAVDDNAAAAKRVRTLLADMQSSRKEVVGTAHMTLGAALMALHDYEAADAEFALALEANPDSSAAPDLWAQLKDLRNDHAGAEHLRKLALENTTTIENFGEVAALYFQLSWRDNEAIIRSRFSNPSVVTFH